MVDASAQSLAHVFPKGRLKHLNPSRDKDKLEVLERFLSGLLTPEFFTQGQQVEVPINTESKPKALVLKYRPETESETELKGHFFLADLLSLLDETKAWMQAYYSYLPAVAATLNQPILKLRLTDLCSDSTQPNIIVESKIWERRGDIESTIEALLAAVDFALASLQPQSKTAVVSLATWIASVKANPVDAWESTIKPLAEVMADQATTAKTLLSIRSGTETNWYAVTEVRTLLNTFTKGIAEYVSTKKITLPAPNLKTLVTDKAESLLFKIDQAPAKSSEDEVRAQEFVRFFTDTMPYVEGKKAVPVVEAPAAAAAPAADGDGDATPPEEKTKPKIEETGAEITYLALIQQLAHEYAPQFLGLTSSWSRLVAAASDGGFPFFVTARQSRDALLVRAESDLKLSLTRIISESDLIAQLSNDQRLAYNPKTKLFIQNAFLVEWMNSYDVKIVQTIWPTIETAFNQMVNEYWEFIEGLQGLDQPATPDTTIDTTAPTPSQTATPTAAQPLSAASTNAIVGPLAELQNIWQAEQTQKGATGGSFYDWWKGLSLADRASFLGRSNQARLVYSAMADRLAYELLSDYFKELKVTGLKPSQFNGLLQDLSKQVLLDLYDLPPGQLADLLRGEMRLRLWADLKQRQLQNAQTRAFLSQVVPEVLKAHLISQLKKQANLDDVSQQNLDMTMDALAMLVDNPEALIQNLQKPQRYNTWFQTRLSDSASDEDVRGTAELLGDYALVHRQQLSDELAEDGMEMVTFLPADQTDFAQLADDRVFAGYTEYLSTLRQNLLTHQKSFFRYAYLPPQQQSGPEQAFTRGYLQRAGFGRTKQTGSLARLIRSNAASQGDPAKQFTKPRWRQALDELAGIKTTTKIIKSLGTEAALTATARVLDAVLPGLGAAVQAGIKTLMAGYKILQQIIGQKTLSDAMKVLIPLAIAGAVFVIQFILHNAIAFFASLAGAMVGGPFGAAAGWAVGHQADKAIAGARDLLSSGGGLATKATGAFNSLISHGVGQVALPTAIVTSAVVGTVFTSNIYNTQGAFLKPLPTISGDEEISKYVTIEKTARPGVNFKDNPTFPKTITYSVSISPKPGYTLQIKADSITDVLTVAVNEEPYKEAGQPVPAPALNGKTRTLAELSVGDNCAGGSPGNADQFPAAEGLITLAPSDTLVFPTYCETYTEEYLHTNVTNTFSIAFSVTDQTDVVVSANETAKTAEVICFGQCPQNQAGCWPTSGYIGQPPYGTYSHDTVDAVDILNAEYPKVYSPFKGEACFYRWRAGGIDPNYGNHVFVKSGEYAIVYGHFTDFEKKDGSSNPVGSCINITETDGKNNVLGTMGTTGFSDAVHLHWEYRKCDAGDRGFGNCTSAIPGQNFGQSGPTRLESISPEQIKFRDSKGKFIRTCYDE